MIISLEGEEAVGKSTFAYTAPLPIVGFSFDFGSDRAIYGTQYDTWFKNLSIEIVKYQAKANTKELYEANKDKDIVIYTLPEPVQLDNTRIVGCIELWDYFIQLYSIAMCDDRLQTAVVDTMTLARRIKSDAYLQELQAKDGSGRKQLLQIEYGHPNDSIRNIYTLTAGLGKNLVSIHHLTDEYKQIPAPGGKVESVSTGNRVLEGLSQTYRYVDIALRMSKNKGQLSGKLLKVGYNLNLEGQELDNPSWDSIVSLIEFSLMNRLKLPHRQETV